MVSRGQAAWAALLVASMLGCGLTLIDMLHLGSQSRERAGVVGQVPDPGGLMAANGALRQEIEELDREIEAYQRGRGLTRLEEMASALNGLRILNGQVAVAGPGIEVRIENRCSAASMRDLVSELQNAGAEALSINNRRVVASTAIYEADGGILIDGHEVEAPLIIRAIGEAAVMRPALLRPGGTLSLLRAAGLSVTVEDRSGADEVCLPPVENLPTFRYASAS